jgi:hypothetical protein
VPAHTLGCSSASRTPRRPHGDHELVACGWTRRRAHGGDRVVGAPSVRRFTGSASTASLLASSIRARKAAQVTSLARATAGFEAVAEARSGEEACGSHARCALTSSWWTSGCRELTASRRVDGWPTRYPRPSSCSSPPTRIPGRGRIRRRTGRGVHAQTGLSFGHASCGLGALLAMAALGQSGCPRRWRGCSFGSPVRGERGSRPAVDSPRARLSASSLEES